MKEKANKEIVQIDGGKRRNRERKKGTEETDDNKTQRNYAQRSFGITVKCEFEEDECKKKQSRFTHVSAYEKSRPPFIATQSESSD
jgi:hypothetical protein